MIPSREPVTYPAREALMLPPPGRTPSVSLAWYDVGMVVGFARGRMRK